MTNLLAAFLQFVNQTWLTVEPEHPSRPTMRRMKRINFEPTIKVIRLRKVKHLPGEKGDHEPVRREHRWFVRGHWRKQWYPSQGRHIPIWINEHIKGPDDAPLLIKDEVFRVDR